MLKPAGFKNHSTPALVQQESSAFFFAPEAQGRECQYVNADAAKIGLLMYTVF
jgi:hypothetical protein